MKEMNIKISDIGPSPENKRKVDQKSPEYKALVTSIAGLGVQVPIKVRPVPDQVPPYEIIYGERRWYAAQSAGLKTIPALVEEMDDATAREVRVVENLLREDLGPTEEAEQVKLLLEDGKITQEVADKLGRSITWVVQRANISTIHPDVLKVAAKNNWSVGTMVAMALFPHERQVELAGHWNLNEDYLRNVFKEEQHKLAAAKWPLDVDFLAPIPACKDCPKRTGFNPVLFEIEEGEVEKNDACLDEACWQKHLDWIILEKVRTAAEKEKPLPLVSKYNERKVGDLQVLGGQNFGYSFVKKNTKGAIEAIDAETGSTVRVVLKQTAKADVEKATGVKQEKPMAEKKAALDLRRWKKLAAEYSERIAKLKYEEIVSRFSELEAERIMLILANALGTSESYPYGSQVKQLRALTYENPGLNAEGYDKMLDRLKWAHSFFNVVKHMSKKLGPDFEIGIHAVQRLLGLNADDEWKRVCEEIPDPKSWSKAPATKQPKAKAKKRKAKSSIKKGEVSK